MIHVYRLFIRLDSFSLVVASFLSLSSLYRARRWWTSGTGVGQTLVWEGDSTKPTLDMRTKWTEEGVSQKANMHIVYAFTSEIISLVVSSAPFSSSKQSKIMGHAVIYCLRHRLQ